MPQINIAISGRTYRMACDDGQEDHLRTLAARLDFKIAEMRVRFGEIGDQRLTVMAALTIVDEADAAEQRAEALAGEVAALRQGSRPGQEEADRVGETAAEAIESIAGRIEAVARLLDIDPPDGAPDAPVADSDR